MEYFLTLYAIALSLTLFIDIENAYLLNRMRNNTYDAGKHAEPRIALLRFKGNTV